VKIFFLHLPKTGGVSFRNECVRYFGPERSVTLYGRDNRTTSAVARNLYFVPEHDLRDGEVRESRLVNHIRTHDVDFFSTHDFRAFLEYFDPAEMVTFVRDPVDRMISHYNFFNLMKKKISGSFEEFYRNPDYHNYQAKLLKDVEISRLGMIGLTERFDESIARINAAFGVALKPRHQNRTFWRPRRIRRANLDDAVLAEIRALNAEDTALYEEAVRRFATVAAI